MNSGRKIAARAGVLALVAGGMTVIAVGPAQADTFIQATRRRLSQV